MSAIGSPNEPSKRLCGINRDAGLSTEMFSEKQEISKRSSVLWKCINRTLDESGGYLYTLRYRKKYDHETFHDPKRRQAAHKRALSIFPALEPMCINLPFLDARVLTECDKLIMPLARQRFRTQFNDYFEKKPNEIFNIMSDIEKKQLKKTVWKATKADHVGYYKKHFANHILNYEVIRQLGYRIERRAPDSNMRAGVFLQLPDEVVLTTRWSQLKQTRPDLPSLFLTNSNGIAGDLEFVKAFMKYSALLSSAGEFCHDHIFHVIPTIVSMLTYGRNAVRERSRVRDIISTIFYKVVEVKKWIDEERAVIEPYTNFLLLQATVGILADVSSSISDLSVSKERFPPDKTSEVFIRSALTSPKQIEALYRRAEFSEIEIIPDRIVELWNEIDQMCVRKIKA